MGYGVYDISNMILYTMPHKIESYCPFVSISNRDNISIEVFFRKYFVNRGYLLGRIRFPFLVHYFFSFFYLKMTLLLKAAFFYRS